jgi:hypothetical protein
MSRSLHYKSVAIMTFTIIASVGSTINVTKGTSWSIHDASRSMIDNYRVTLKTVLKVISCL